MTPRLFALIIVIIIGAIITSLRVAEGIDNERRIREQRQGDVPQLVNNLLSGCGVTFLLFVLALVVLYVAGPAD